MEEKYNVTYKDIEKVNQEINTRPIKGKEYAEVQERIKAFRKLHPNGSITTEIYSIENGICIMKATVKDEFGKVLGTGTAYEKENSTYINKTSYIENCETSAVGRALGMAGFGIDTSVASAEEVINAINNQNTTTQEQEEFEIIDENESFLENAKTYILPVGKYKGKTLAEINKKDRQYLSWYYKNGNNAMIKSFINIILNNN